MKIKKVRKSDLKTFIKLMSYASYISDYASAMHETRKRNNIGIEK